MKQSKPRRTNSFVGVVLVAILCGVRKLSGAIARQRATVGASEGDPRRSHQTLPLGAVVPHMVSDQSVEELHAFASEIGLRRGWFQGGPRPHYDVRPSGRRVAVSKGAEQVGARELVKRMARG